VCSVPCVDGLSIGIGRYSICYVAWYNGTSSDRVSKRISPIIRISGTLSLRVAVGTTTTDPTIHSYIPTYIHTPWQTSIA
jgi:hypothetical protein